MIKKLIIASLIICSAHMSASRLSAQDKDSIQSPIPTQELAVPAEAPSTGIDLTLSPIFVNLVVKPGGTIQTPVKIKNNSNTTEYLTIRVAKFTASPDGSQPLITDVDPQDEFLKWISFSEKEFKLAPNQTKTIQVTIQPSASAGLGYYYGLVFERIQESDTQTSGATVAGAPAISILLEVKSSKAKRELQLVDFSTDKLFYEYLPTTFKLKVKNTGNIHSVPVGDIFIESMNNPAVGSIRINESLGNVLPQSQRTFEISWDDAMVFLKNEVDASGKTTSKTTWDLTKADKFRIGRYTAHVLMVYDNGDRDVPIEAEVSFWVFPWKIILVAGLVLLLALVGLRSFALSLKRKITRR